MPAPRRVPTTSHRPSRRAGGLLWLTLLAGIALVVPVAVSAAPNVIRVPSDFPTIQTAIDAAHPGDTIRIRAGTYVEQLSIDKDLKLVGAGAWKTIVRAPSTLTAGADGRTAIVEVHGGASVKISHLTVSGPGAGTCANGELRAGISVLQESALDLSHARVLHIHNTPLDDCFRSGVAVLAADFSGVDVDIDHSEIRDYGGAAVVIAGEASTVDIRYNVVTGPGRSKIVTTGGIELLGATGTISHNIVSGNACGSPDFGCGPDWFDEFQQAGIGGGAPGLVISNNRLFGNQVGIYVDVAATIKDNVLWDNDYFGIALQDGSFTVSGDRIRGGEGGVAVIAAFDDANAKLRHVRISHTSGDEIQKFECCGFTATVDGP